MTVARIVTVAEKQSRLLTTKLTFWPLIQTEELLLQVVAHLASMRLARLSFARCAAGD